MSRSSMRTARVNGRDLDVVDAKDRLTFTVTEKDVKHADPRSPKSCAFAVAIRRITNADSVCIGHKFAYVPWDTDGDGLPDIVRRYAPELKASQVIEEFDRTGKFRAGEYHFNPPSKSNLLRNGRSKKFRQKQREQKVAGKRIVAKKPKGKPKFIGVRNMTGMVHFIMNKEMSHSQVISKGVHKESPQVNLGL